MGMLHREGSWVGGVGAEVTSIRLVIDYKNIVSGNCGNFVE